MSTASRTLPVILDAADVDALPTKPLGDIPGVILRPLWSDGRSSAGILTVEAGHRLGAHTHRHHHHHIWVVDGTARVLGRDIGPGSYAHIPLGLEHDVDATETDGCSILYLYLTEDPPPAG